MTYDQHELSSNRYNALRNLKVETGKEGYLYWTKEFNGEKIEGVVDRQEIVLERSNESSGNGEESTYLGILKNVPMDVEGKIRVNIPLEPKEAKEFWTKYHDFGIPKKREDEILEKIEQEKILAKKKEVLKELL